jgi:hypothetical protein
MKLTCTKWILFLASLTFATASADQQTIEIEMSSSARLGGSGMMDCCSFVNISTNPSEIMTKNCNVQGGYCMGSKQFAVWTYDTSLIPEGSSIITASFNGERSGATGYGFLKFMSTNTSTITTTSGGYLFSSGMNQTVNWSSAANFALNLSTSARNLILEDQFIMVGAYQASTTSMIIRNSAYAPKLSLLIDTPEQECDADFNDDNYVNVSDMLQLIESWGVCWNKSCDADLDNDNLVTVSDLLLLIDAWGTCP